MTDEEPNMPSVTKWSCPGCHVAAMKSANGRSWVILHHSRCPITPGSTENVGPVTSVNDPDNVYLVRSYDDDDD